MLQQKIFSKRLVQSDSKYKSRLVTLVILRVLQSGKKYLARRIVYKALKIVAVKTRRAPLSILRIAVRRAAPEVGVRKRRVRRRVFQYPIQVGPIRGTKLSIRWMVERARLRSGRSMADRLAVEVIAAAKGLGSVRRKEQLYKLADSYRHFDFAKDGWKKLFSKLQEKRVPKKLPKRD